MTISVYLLFVSITFLVKFINVKFSDWNTIFIVLYIDDEIKYDKYHEHADRIYRVNRLYNSNDVDEDAATLSFPAGPTLVMDYPGIVEKQVRFFNQLNRSLEWLFEF